MVLRALKFVPVPMVVTLVVASVLLLVTRPLTALGSGAVVASAVAGHVSIGGIVVLCLGVAGGGSIQQCVALLNTAIGRAADGAVRSRVRLLLGNATDLGVAESAEVTEAVGLVGASGGTNGHSPSVGAGAFSVIQNVFRPLGMLAFAAVLVTVWWPLAIVVLVLTFSIIESQRRAELRRSDDAALEARAARRSGYWRELGASSAAARELRVFGWGDWLRQRYQRDAYAGLEPIWQRRRANFAGRWLPYLLTAITAAVSYGGTTALAWLQIIPAGQVITAIVAITGMLNQTSSRGILGAVGYAHKAMLALERLEVLLAPGQAAAAGPGLRLDRVSFGYGDGPDVLRGVDLELASGAVLGLVGVNGAGKTTLAKLIAGLYHPRAGKVCIPAAPDGTPAAPAVLLADFNRYPLSLADNVRAGAFGPGSSDGLSDTARVTEALRVAGAAKLADRLPQGTATMLSKLYDGGVDLSGGQWQKVALARLTYAVRSGSRLVIMDEPTAHLDAAAEAEFFDAVVRALSGATIVLISHRLSTVRSADHIVVLADGVIAESGSHADLIRLGGHYASMFALQAGRFETSHVTASKPEVTR